jgi:hypothetical protein
LLTHGISESNGTVGFLVQELGHSGVSNDIAGMFNDVKVEVTDKAGRNV